MPQQLAIGLAIHQAIRSKEIVNFLYGFGMSVEYNRILRVEAQIEKHVVRGMERSGGIYVPSDDIIKIIIISETRLLECADPPAKPKSLIYPSFNLSTDELPITVKLKDFATCVFVLALRRYPDLCQNTVFVTGKGDTYRTIKLQPIVRALGPLKTAALPSFHALTGADNTGSFAKKGKSTCWSVFKEAHYDVIQALSQLGTSDLPSDETVKR